MGKEKTVNGEKTLFPEADPAEKPDASELLPEVAEMESAKEVMVLTDEETILALERAAEYAPRMEEAMRKILVAIAYPEDWTDQGGTACLSSAGSERFLKHFRIQFSNWTAEKVEWSDDIGDAYRWIYRALASWKGRTVMCEGKYSSRDPFLGKKAGEFRPLTDIDEGDIMSAAMHVCQGAGIKTLLGLRRIPVSELIRFGLPQDKIQKVERGKGTQGGATGDEKSMQSEIRGWLLQICDNNESEAKRLLVMLSEYVCTKDGKKYKKGDKVEGVQSSSALKGGRLKVVHDKAKREFESWEKDQKGGT